MEKFKVSLMGVKKCFVEHFGLVETAFDIIEHYALKEPDTIEVDMEIYRTNYKPFDDNLNKIIPYLPKDNITVWFQLGCIYNTFINMERPPMRNFFMGQVVDLNIKNDISGVVVAPLSGFDLKGECYLTISPNVRCFWDEPRLILRIEDSLRDKSSAVILNQNLLDYVHTHAEELNQTLKIIASDGELRGRLWGFRYEGAENEKMRRDKIIPYSLSFGLSSKKISLDYYRVGFIVDRYGNVIHTDYPQSLRILPW